LHNACTFILQFPLTCTDGDEKCYLGSPAKSKHSSDLASFTGVEKKNDQAKKLS